MKSAFDWAGCCCWGRGFGCAGVGVSGIDDELDAWLLPSARMASAVKFCILKEERLNVERRDARWDEVKKTPALGQSEADGPDAQLTSRAALFFRSVPITSSTNSARHHARNQAHYELPSPAAPRPRADSNALHLDRRPWDQDSRCRWLGPDGSRYRIRRCQGTKPLCGSQLELGERVGPAPTSPSLAASTGPDDGKSHLQTAGVQVLITDNSEQQLANGLAFMGERGPLVVSLAFAGLTNARAHRQPSCSRRMSRRTA